MIRYKQLLILNLIDKETEKPIGKVLDVIYSDDYRTVTYLVVKNKNLIKNKFPIDYKDVVFADNSNILYLNNKNYSEDKLENIVEEGFKFIDKEIKNENEESIGYIKDILINKEKGNVEGFIISEGIFEDIIKGRNYIPLFQNIMINEDCIYINSKDLIKFSKNS